MNSDKLKNHHHNKYAMKTIECIAEDIQELHEGNVQCELLMKGSSSPGDAVSSPWGSGDQKPTHLGY